MMRDELVVDAVERAAGGGYADDDHRDDAADQAVLDGGRAALVGPEAPDQRSAPSRSSTLFKADQPDG